MLLLTITYFVAVAALPVYLVYLSLVLRSAWQRSKARAVALVLPLIPLLAFLAAPLVYAY